MSGFLVEAPTAGTVLSGRIGEVNATGSFKQNINWVIVYGYARGRSFPIVSYNALSSPEFPWRQGKTQESLEATVEHDPWKIQRVTEPVSVETSREPEEVHYEMFVWNVIDWEAAHDEIPARNIADWFEPCRTLGTQVGHVERLSALYSIENSAAVTQFCSQHPNLVELFLEIHQQIARIFQDKIVRVKLAYFRDPEEDDDWLSVTIETMAPPEIAVALLNRFDEEWWLDVESDAARLINVMVRSR